MQVLTYTELPYAEPRIVPVDIGRYNVAGYGIDNGYPQRMQSLIKASPTAKMACNLYADYIFGQGFSVGDGKTKHGADSEDGLWNTVLNSKGHTGDDMLAMTSNDYSKFEKFYLHINYNALFNGVEVNYVPYNTARYGVLEREGQIALFNNWWNLDRFGRIRQNVDKPVYIDMFNPDPVEIKRQVSAAGGWKSYNGQIFEFSNSFEQYPESTLDAGIDAMRAEILSYKTSYANIKNNFGDKIVWLQKGKFETDAQRREWVENAQSFTGVDGAQLMLCEIESEGQEPDFKTIENRLDDKKFSYTDTKTRSTIYRLLGQNAILHSDLTEGRYNQNQLSEAIKAYNNRTERARINMQRAFKTVTDVLGYDFDCGITPINELTTAAQNTQGANDNGNNTDIPNKES